MQLGSKCLVSSGESLPTLLGSIEEGDCSWGYWLVCAAGHTEARGLSKPLHDLFQALLKPLPDRTALEVRKMCGSSMPAGQFHRIATTPDSFHSATSTCRFEIVVYQDCHYYPAYINEAGGSTKNDHQAKKATHFPSP